MSERITQELRKKMKSALGWYDEDGNIVCSTGGEPVSEMECFVINSKAFGNCCDAIDAVHANLERENDRLKCELDRVLGELDDMHKTDGISDNSGCFMQNAEHHAWAPESHYVMLPKDAKGEPIHVGDELDGYGKTIEVVELRYGRSGWVLISREGNGYADTFAFTHYHAPTVEDVLREFVSEFNRDDTELCDEEIIERFAAKLRLVGDAQ